MEDYNNDTEPIKVVIEEFSTEYGLYDESGQCIETGFESYEESWKFAFDNGYEVVETFNI